MRVLQALAILFCASILAFAAPSCGGGSKAVQGTKPEEWVGNFCRAFLEWGRAVRSNHAEAAQRHPGPRDSAGKARATFGLTKDIASTQRLIRKIQARKPPAVKDGARLQSGLESALAGIRDNFSHERAIAERLPVGNHKAYVRESAALQRAIERDFSDTSPAAQAFKTLENRDLDKAFDGDPTCQRFPR